MLYSVAFFPSHGYDPDPIPGYHADMKKLSEVVTAYRCFLYDSELADTTVRKYVANVEKLFAFSGLYNPARFTGKQLREYRQFLISTMEPASVNTCIIACNRFFSWYGRYDLHLSMLKIQRSNVLEHVFSLSEYNRMLTTAEKDGNTMMYLIMRVLGSSGIRISELKYVTVEMLGKRFARIQNKGKNRTVFFSASLCGELRTFCREHGIRSGVIFHSRHSSRMLTPSTVWRQLKKTAVRAAVPPESVHAHAFRHFFAREFMKKYGNICELADILGHSSLETTRIYTRTGYDEKRKMMDELNL